MPASRSTVFVVDDDPSFLTAVSRLLRATGHPVKTFSSAAEFLQNLPAAGPGCVVADLQMPGLSGLDLQAALAVLPRWARPVFLRLTDEIARTETFKPKRAAYVEQGFDPAASGDLLFIAEGEGFRPLTPSAYEAVLSGALRV